jgi:hypothetical protein
VEVAEQGIGAVDEGLLLRDRVHSTSPRAHPTLTVRTVKVGP